MMSHATTDTQRQAADCPRCALSTGSAKTVPCPECYGGHFRPCQICGDSGWIEVVPGQIHACDCKRKFTNFNRNNHIPLLPNNIKMTERGGQ